MRRSACSRRAPAAARPGARDPGAAADRGRDGAVRPRLRAVRAALGARRADRAPALAAELAGDGIKLLVVASLQIGEDALEAIAAAAGVPTLALDATLPQAAARARAGRIAAIWADGTLRAGPWLKAAPVRARRRRGGAAAVAGPGGRRSRPAALPIRRACRRCRTTAWWRCSTRTRRRRRRGSPTRSTAPASSAERVHRQLMRMQALARRKRAGRILLRSSHPVRAQAALGGPHATR